MVAAQRYEITHEIRTILKLHFEDYFQSLNDVKEMARRLQDVTTRTKNTVRLLLNACSNQPATLHQSATNIDKTRSRPFDRLWSLHSNCNDKEVLGFSTWAVFLLHFMVHKAHCVLFRPLFRDQSLGADEFIRTK
jgi:hypothetical protein